MLRHFSAKPAKKRVFSPVLRGCNCQLRNFQGELVVCNRFFGYDWAIKQTEPARREASPDASAAHLRQRQER